MVFEVFAADGEGVDVAREVPSGPGLVGIDHEPGVRGAAVVARPDPRLGETPVAMVELRDDADPAPDDAALAEYLRPRLAGYEIPTEIAVVADIPRTPSGKPDLSAVRAHFAAPVTADGR